MTHPAWLELAAVGSSEQRPPLLTEKEARRQLSVSRETLAQMIRDKQITAIKVRSRWRFRQSDVDRYLSEQENMRSVS